MRSIFLASVLIASLIAADSAVAQEQNPDWPWSPITTVEGLRILYLFYSEADNENNGVVVKLSNTTDKSLSYSFTIVFRPARGDEEERQITGSIDAGQEKTGDHDGLFWIPFEDGREVAEVGLRRLRVSVR